MTLGSLALAALAGTAWLGAGACASDTPPTAVVTPPQGVVVESVSPSSGPPGTAVVIRGSGFTPTDNDIAFTYPSGAQRQHTAYLNRISSPDGETLRFSLPDNYDVLLGDCAFSQLEANEACDDIGYQLPAGESEMFVINENGESNRVTFVVSVP